MIFQRHGICNLRMGKLITILRSYNNCPDRSSLFGPHKISFLNVRLRKITMTVFNYLVNSWRGSRVRAMPIIRELFMFESYYFPAKKSLPTMNPREPYQLSTNVSRFQLNFLGFEMLISFATN